MSQTWIARVVQVEAAGQRARQVDQADRAGHPDADTGSPRLDALVAVTDDGELDVLPAAPRRQWIEVAGSRELTVRTAPRGVELDDADVVRVRERQPAGPARMRNRRPGRVARARIAGEAGTRHARRPAGGGRDRTGVEPDDRPRRALPCSGRRRGTCPRRSASPCSARAAPRLRCGTRQDRPTGGRFRRARPTGQPPPGRRTPPAPPPPPAVRIVCASGSLRSLRCDRPRPQTLPHRSRATDGPNPLEGGFQHSAAVA